MSGLPPVATVATTSQIGGFVPTADLHKPPEGARVERCLMAGNVATLPCGSVADQGCRQFDPAPVGRLARRGGHKYVRRILKEGSYNGAMAPADDHQFAIGGLPLSEDRLFRRKAAGRIIGS
jgi:hypothetical protein